MKQQFPVINYLCLAFLLFIQIKPLTAQPPTITYLAETTGFNAPVDVVNAGDGSNRLFIVEQAGKIKVRNGLTVTQFADFGTTGANIITSGGERGLLSMVFHPDFDGVTNRYFFIYYTDLSGNIAVSRLQTTAGNSNTADISTLINIITIPHPGQSNHNGGKLNFGQDGYLYFGLGDGGGGNDVPNNAQTGTVLLGKMLRIDIDNTSILGNYAIPADNPYVGDPAIDDHIWALGLRNPYRWSFDRQNGDMWIGDVGQGAQEEVNYRAAGNTGHVNYGWRCFEGFPSTPGVADCTPVDYIPPVYDYPNPAAGSSSVVGGYVYRGAEFPNFQGYYISADVYSGDIHILWPNGSGGFDSSVQASSNTFIVGFGEGEDGTLYAVSQGTNTLYKVIATGGAVPVMLKDFSGKSAFGYNDVNWQTVTETNTVSFDLEYGYDGRNFSKATSVIALQSANGHQYQFRHQTDNKNDIYYRLAIHDDQQQVKYSKIIKLNGSGDHGIRLYSTVISNHVLTAELLNKNVTTIALFNSTGANIFNTTISIPAGKMEFHLPVLAAGIYFVKFSGTGFSQTERILIQ